VRQTLHPVAYSTDLGTSPLSVRLLGEPLVIWRDSAGTAHATSDVCVHRGTALSGGCVKGDTIMCPYHGWQFDETGKCTHIPQLEDPTKVPSKAQIAAHHCVEQYNMIWVSLDQPRRPLPAIDEFGSSDWVWVNCGPYDWNAHSSRQLENFTDFGHFPWVHPGLLRSSH
jgi:vanillate O-demethylase monooxygenase subunit